MTNENQEKTCYDCVHFNGEECSGGMHDGDERYGFSPACEELEESDMAKLNTPFTY